ncbi:MAG: hypothetical protein ACYC62_00600, partial [Coriobacteriia bacterium]
MGKSVQQLPGVLAADVNFATGMLRIEYDRTNDPRRRAVGVVVGSGHGIEAMDAADSPGLPAVSWWTRNRTEVSVGISAVLLVLGWLLGWLGADTAGM